MAAVEPGVVSNVEAAPEAGLAPHPDDVIASTELEPSAPGTVSVFDGTRMYLRSFPVWYRWRQVPDGQWAPGRPESGSVDGVAFEQTMGRMVLCYDLGGDDWTEDDILVEMSCWELRVSIGKDAGESKQGGTKVPQLCKELFSDIRRRLSWWRIEQDSTGYGRRLVIHLAKLEHRAWRGPWHLDPLNIHRKTAFGWGPYHLSQQLLKALKANDESLARVPPGEPQDFGKSLCVAIPPQRLCTGVDDDEEDANYIYIVVHLDEEALETATARVPLEELFCANVDANYVEVHLRGDGFGICWGGLQGLCVPELSTWEIASVRRRNLPKDSGIKCPAFYNPALRIRLAKDQGYQHTWGHAFEGKQCPQFELPRERINWTERVQRALVLSPAAPLNATAKADRARHLCTRIECREDLLLNRVTILFHLEDRLESLAAKYSVDVGTFFSLKVGERLLEVNVVADSEFTMCAGGLGGACTPERTSWEVVRQRGSAAPGAPEEQDQEHLALKICLSKAPGFRDRWEQVFTLWEPWQVTEHLIQDQQAAAAALENGAAIARASEENGEDDYD